MNRVNVFPTQCECKARYSIEPHGDGHALYLGRCNHKHGFNLGQISDTWPNTLDFLNAPLAAAETVQEAYNDMLIELCDSKDALTPSAETKKAYWGSDELPVMVWSDIKIMMRLIREYAAKKGKRI